MRRPITIKLPASKQKEDLEVLHTGANKIILHENHLEFARQAEVVREDEATGRKTVTFDEYSLLNRESITGVTYNYSDKEGYYSLEIHTVSEASLLCIAYPVEQKEQGEQVARQIFEWSMQ